MGKRIKEVSSFRSVLWTQVSHVGRWLFFPREARKRAVIRLLDQVKAQGPTPPMKPGI